MCSYEGGYCWEDGAEVSAAELVGSEGDGKVVRSREGVGRKCSFGIDGDDEVVLVCEAVRYCLQICDVKG